MGDTGSLFLSQKTFCQTSPPALQGNSSRIWGSFPSIGGMRSPWQSPGRAPWDSPRKGHFVTAVTSWVPSHSGHSIPVHPHVSPRFWGTGEPPDGSGGRIPPGQGGTWRPSAPETKRDGIGIGGANPGDYLQPRSPKLCPLGKHSGWEEPGSVLWKTLRNGV